MTTDQHRSPTELATGEGPPVEIATPDLERRRAVEWQSAEKPAEWHEGTEGVLTADRDAAVARRRAVDEVDAQVLHRGKAGLDKDRCNAPVEVARDRRVRVVHDLPFSPAGAQCGPSADECVLVGAVLQQVAADGAGPALVRTVSLTVHACPHDGR